MQGISQLGSQIPLGFHYRKSGYLLIGNRLTKVRNAYLLLFLINMPLFNQYRDGWSVFTFIGSQLSWPPIFLFSSTQQIAWLNDFL